MGAGLSSPALRVLAGLAERPLLLCTAGEALSLPRCPGDRQAGPHTLGRHMWAPVPSEAPGSQRAELPGWGSSKTRSQGLCLRSPR